jgi:hypothetical protein
LTIFKGILFPIIVLFSRRVENEPIFGVDVSGAEQIN